LRLRGADTATVDHALNELVTSGVIVGWWPTVYEPETAAFGGPVGMGIAHDLFCADSQGVLDYLRHTSPGLGRRELSVVLLGGLMRAAGLDGFEVGDVFDRVARLRPAPTATDAARVDRLAGQVRTLLATPTSPDSTLFTTGGPVAHAAPWLVAFHRSGRELGDAATDGRLERGLRAALVHVVIFHWNRFGLSAAFQGVLARAAAAAALPRS
jgi:thiopeptide-type bacteriocin biosynthesis protein